MKKIFIISLILILSFNGFSQVRLLSVGVPIKSSSDYSALYVAKFSNDGNYTSRWSSAFSDPQWIYQDLQVQCNITRIKVTWEGASGKDFLLQTSDDSVTWKTILTVTSNGTLTNDFNVTGQGRYVRMYGTKRTTIFGYSIFEMEVYGMPVITPPIPTQYYTKAQTDSLFKSQKEHNDSLYNNLSDLILINDSTIVAPFTPTLKVQWPVKKIN